MQINQLLMKAGMTRYRLSKSSGVPQTTINDICSGKARIEKCSAETLYRISKALGVTMESLIESEMKEDSAMEYRSSYEVFKSNVCHYVKDKGDIEFIIDTLESDRIRKLYDKHWYPEAFYLLAMVDYLSRENNVPLCTNYNDIRAQKLQKTLFPTSLLIAAAALKSERLRTDAINHAIPEFMRFNIVENEVRNVY